VVFGLALYRSGAMSFSLPPIVRVQLLIHDLLARLGYGLVKLSFPSKIERLGLVREAQHDRLMLLTATEAWTLSSLVSSVRHIDGNLAEVGTFRGASAALIARSSDGRKIHVFDTFEGLPEPSQGERSLGWWSRAGEFAADYEDVVRYLSRWPNIVVHKGFFPDTAKGIDHESFSFVHLDVDLYESTLLCLEWFYPRMQKGGIILSHDHSVCEGVKRAFDVFRTRIQDPLIELATNQCMIVRI